MQLAELPLISMTLEYLAMRWLRWEKRCPVIIRERSPRCWSNGRPDVLGVTESRFMIEIEIKRSMSDYRANRIKLSQRNRDLYPNRHPKQFYYLVLPKMVDAVQAELEPHAGLMTVENEVCVKVVKPAPVNKLSEKLSLREAVHLAHLMSNHLMSEMELTARLKSRSEGWWWDDDFSI